MTTTATTFDPLLSSTPHSSPGSPGLVAWYAEGLSDPFGDRLQLFDNAGPPMELLRIRHALAASPGFEPALRLRVSELEALRHPNLARVRSVTMLDDPIPALALVSELAEGERLSGLLRAFEQAGVRPDPSGAVWLLRRLLPALGALHERGPAVSHGLLTPNRIVFAPGGGVVITECALGSALAVLGLAPYEIWKQFGLTYRTGVPGLWPHRANDIAQAGFLAAAVLLGRPLRLPEVTAVPELIEDACAAWPAASKMKPWFRRALGPDPAYESADEALDALDTVTHDVLEAWPGKLLPVSALPTRAVDVSRGTSLPAQIAPQPVRLPARPEARLLPPPAATADPQPKAATRWLRVANAALVTVALAEGIVLLAQLVRGPAPAAVRAPLQPVKPVVAHTTILPGLPPAADPSAGAGTPKAAAPRTTVGWVLVESRVPVKVTANGKLLGTSAHARYHLPPGRHTLTLENQQHGVSFTEPLDLAAGQTVLVTVDPPR